MNLKCLGLAGLVFLLSYWLTERLCSPASRLCLLDRPNERSLHTQPTPRTGGLAILGSLAIGLLLSQIAGMELGWPHASLWANQEGAQAEKALWILGMALLIGAVSFWDDRVGLPPGIRFGIHGVATAGVVGGLG